LRASAADASESSGGSELRVAVVCGDRGVSATGRSGASEQLRSICRGLQDSGARVELWCQRISPGSSSTQVALPPGLKVHEAPRGHLPGFLRKRPHWDHGVDGLAMSRWVLTQSRRFQPDLIYERFSLFSSPGSRAARLLGIPWVVELNAPLAWEGALFRGLRPSRALLRRESKMLTTADLVVCVSQELADYALRRGVTPGRILVLNNGAQFVCEAPGDLATDAPAGGGRGPGTTPFILGYAGSFKAWHGLSASLPALRRLQARVAPRQLHLDLWGDGPERATFAALLLEEPRISLCLRGWGGAEELVLARRSWDAAWVPLAAWPPHSTSTGQPVSELVAVFGEEVPPRYFSPLKDAEARAQRVPVWRGGVDEIPSLQQAPSTWRRVAESILSRSGFTPGPASWDDAVRCHSNLSPNP